jgi:guanylate kinase
MLRDGLYFVISGPSGVGKGTIVQLLMQRRNDLALSISYTSRPPRAGERHGVEYYFVTREEFEAMINAQEFLEYALVHGNYYGTSKRKLQELTHQGKQVVFEVDVQGGLSLKKVKPDIVSIFLLPPSEEELVQRIKKRGSETAETLAKRLQTMRTELAKAPLYDNAVVNNDLEIAYQDIVRIIETTKQKKGI